MSDRIQNVHRRGRIYRIYNRKVRLNGCARDDGRAGRVGHLRERVYRVADFINEYLSVEIAVFIRVRARIVEARDEDQRTSVAAQYRGRIEPLVGEIDSRIHVA